MEGYSKGFISFIVSYISSHSESPKVSEALVKRMMRMKNVQKIIIEAMSQLSSLIYQEILSLENIKTTTYYKIPPKNSKLLTIAEDVKNILNNYIFIQSKVSDMREIIDSFDQHLELPDESKPPDPLFTSAYHFLSALPPSQAASNDEIEEISKELWSKQLEMETMLKVEVLKLRQFQNSIENRFFYKNDFIKTRAGLKMKAIEEEKERMRERLVERIERLRLSYEEMLSVEYEKNLSEDKRISLLFDPTSIKYLPEAIAKIKELIGIKLIYEKKRNKDEKLIKGLNTKLQLLVDSYSSLSDKHEDLELRFEELRKNNQALAEASSFASPKNRDKRLVTVQDSLKFEPVRPEVMFSEFPVRKPDAAEAKGLNSKARNDSIKIYRTETRLDRGKRTSPRKKVRTATPAARTHLPSAQQFQKTQDRQENAIKEFKQALIIIDENFKKTNKALTEGLEDLVGSNFDMEIQEESRSMAQKLSLEAKESKTPAGKPAEPRNNPQVSSPQPTDSSFVLDSSATLPNEKEVQVERTNSTSLASQASHAIKLSKPSKASQTVSKLFSNLARAFKALRSSPKLLGKTEADLEGLLLEAFSSHLREVKDSACQCEKEPDRQIELKMSSKELIKGLLKRDKKTTHLKEDSGVKDSSIIEKIIKIPVFSEQSFEDIKEEQISQLVLATKQYKQEFAIQAQLKGYKKLEPGNTQSLWEEIINRRITEGEQDKISVYLRGLLGSANFEQEKKSVIEMIEISKVQDLSPPLKPARDSLKPMQSWKRLMTALLSSKISYFTKFIFSLDDPVDKLYETSKKLKFVKHRLPRGSKALSKIINEDSDTFGFTKSDKWIVRSVTPSLVKTARVKSRHFNTRRNHTTDKFKPAGKIINLDSVQSPLRP